MASKYFSDDTIVAIATPPGEGGIGILRISGPEALAALQRIYQGKLPVKQWQSHRLYLSHWVDPCTEEPIDQGLSVWMRGPHSFTGEDVVELHAHGGPLILNRLLNVLVQGGLRVAQPGEFTRRAFLNNRMDLLQAEAVGEMIQAKSDRALANAQRQLSGRLSEAVTQLKERLIGLLARVEAAIDFPDEDIEILSGAKTLIEVEALADTLKQWEGRFTVGRLIREGVCLALVGRPNVGKSSLLNAWVGESRAIVHATPGTTRDVVEATVDLGGVHCQLMDTAGIRSGSDAVEQEGITRSKQWLQRAHWTLWVVDLNEPWDADDEAIAQELVGPTLLVGNKVDLPQRKFHPPAELFSRIPHLQTQWCEVSAKTGAGLPDLQDRLIQLLGLHGLQEHSEAYLNNGRHRHALQGAGQAMERARQALQPGMPLECVAADLKEATGYLEALLGEVSPEVVLDKIFAEFCLGK